MFGSDYPFYSQENTVAIIREFQNHLEADGVLENEDIERILNGNGERFCLKYNIFKEERE